MFIYYDVYAWDDSYVGCYDDEWDADDVATECCGYYLMRKEEE